MARVQNLGSVSLSLNKPPVTASRTKCHHIRPTKSHGFVTVTLWKNLPSSSVSGTLFSSEHQLYTAHCD